MKIINTLKKSLVFKMTLLMGLSSFTNQTICDNSENTTAAICVVGACLAVGTIIYYQLNPSVESLKANSFETLQKTINYKSPIEILNRRFTLIHLSPLEQRIKADTIDEYLLNDLAPHVRPTTEKYLSNIYYLVKDLKYYPERIESKLYGSNPITDDDIVILRELLHKIKKSTLELGFLSLYIETHKNYFKLHSTCSELKEKFATQISILYKHQNPLYSVNSHLTDEIKSSIRSKYFNHLYPFSQFVADVNVDLNELTNYKNKLAYSYSGINTYSSNLKSELIFIRDCITGSSEYLNEKQMQENAKKEKEKLALKEREVAAKEVATLAKLKEAEARQQELKNREREIEIKQRELELKEKELRDKEIQATQAQG